MVNGSVKLNRQMVWQLDLNPVHERQLACWPVNVDVYFGDNSKEALVYYHSYMADKPETAQLTRKCILFF